MHRLPSLHALRAFEAAARHRHFTRAAEELGLTPTAISHQVKLLEALLGVQLFRRFPRPLSLTAEGETLYPVLRDCFERMAASIDGLKAAVGARPLTVSINLSLASRWLMPRLSRLRAEAGLNLIIEADDRIVDLHSRTVDFAIRYTASPAREFVSYPLFADRMIPVCVPELLDRLGPVQIAADLARFPLVHYRWKTQRPDAPSWDRWFREHASDSCVAVSSVPVALQVSEELHAIEAALAGEGVCLASDIEVSLDILAGRLVVPIDLGLDGFTFRVVHLRSSRRVPEIKRFVEWATREATSLSRDQSRDLRTV